MANLTAEELDFIKTGSAEYTKIKIGLGELELQKQGLIKQVLLKHLLTMIKLLLRNMVLIQ